MRKVIANQELLLFLFADLPQLLLQHTNMVFMYSKFEWQVLSN